mgnify:CR=1 FL=1
MGFAAAGSRRPGICKTRMGGLAAGKTFARCTRVARRSGLWREQSPAVRDPLQQLRRTSQGCRCDGRDVETAGGRGQPVQQRGRISLSRSGWIADLPTPENFLLVHQQANGGGNYSGYDNPDYDRLLARAIAEPNPSKRQRLMRKAEALLIADMPILPLYFYVTRSLVAKRITGWKDNISNVHPSRTLRIRP